MRAVIRAVPSPPGPPEGAVASFPSTPLPPAASRQPPVAVEGAVASSPSVAPVPPAASRQPPAGGGAAPPAAGSVVSRLLFLEVLPDPGGRVSFGILGLAVLAHLFVVPDPGGYTGRFLEGAPGILGGRLFQASLEGMVEAVLVLAPAIALYGGLRHLLSRSEHLLPYLTVAGGGFLSLLTACALVCL